MLGFEMNRKRDDDPVHRQAHIAEFITQKARSTRPPILEQLYQFKMKCLKLSSWQMCRLSWVPILWITIFRTTLYWQMHQSTKILTQEIQITKKLLLPLFHFYFWRGKLKSENDSSFVTTCREASFKGGNQQINRPNTRFLFTYKLNWSAEKINSKSGRYERI